MCVNSKGYDWERPAVQGDIPYLSTTFPGVDFHGALEAMSTDGGKPLTTDLALIGAMVSTPPDELGMCYVPFVGLNQRTREMVKLPVMEQVVDWCENSALGTDMWGHASDWCEDRYGGRFHFAMNCGCGKVSSEAKKLGNWQLWKQRFNQSRADVFGRTRVVMQDSNSIDDLDITSSQLLMWYRIRQTLESLPRYAGQEILAVA